MESKMQLKNLSFFLTLFAISHTATAISLTSHRIYLDKDKRTASFLVLNRTQDAEDCQASFRYFTFSQAGIMGKEIKDTLPSNNANRIVSFSPRKFSVPAGATQTIRLSLRRKPGDKGSEYHSYLSLNCGKSDPETPELINVSPRLVHNVPVVARTGDLSVTASIDDVKLSPDGKLDFTLNRLGDRSIYGNLDIFDKTTGKRLNGLKALSLYIQSDYRDFSFTIPNNVKLADIMIRFTEDKAYGGSLSIAYNN